jgi:hypothetical protein
MTDDLVKRLRAEDPETGLRWSIASEAADRIELLQSLFPAILQYLEAQADWTMQNKIPTPNKAMQLLIWTKHLLEKYDGQKV